MTRSSEREQCLRADQFYARVIGVCALLRLRIQHRVVDRNRMVADQELHVSIASRHDFPHALRPHGGVHLAQCLDANNCLILTNLEYASDPKGAKLLNRRTNARFRGSSMARTDAFIRGRELTDAQVHAFNRILKDRARKYVAASKPEWLHPEVHCKLQWRELATLLLPKKELWRERLAVPP